MCNSLSYSSTVWYSSVSGLFIGKEDRAEHLRRLLGFVLNIGFFALLLQQKIQFGGLPSVGLKLWNALCNSRTFDWHWSKWIQHTNTWFEHAKIFGQGRRCLSGAFLCQLFFQTSASFNAIFQNSECTRMTGNWRSGIHSLPRTIWPFGFCCCKSVKIC